MDNDNDTKNYDEVKRNPLEVYHPIDRKPFHDPYQFQFVFELEKHFEDIKKEFLNLKNVSFHLWPERELYVQQGQVGQGWEVFGLRAFNKKHLKNMELCPITTQLIQSIPRVTTAAFSILNPKTTILPHCGYYGHSEAVYRLHLGLIIPPSCYLRVANEVQYWSEGKCMVFDDTFTHSAVNDSDQTRVVLLLDFMLTPPDPNAPKHPKDQNDYLDKLTNSYGYEKI